MSDGFGLDEEQGDGGAFDLNDNGTALDELVLFAAIDDAGRRSRGLPPRRPGCGCALPALVLGLLAILAAL